MMTVSLSVADVLSERVTLQVESIDRLYLNLYQPRLMHAGGVAQFFRSHQGATFASSALMAPMTRAFQAAVLRFAETANVNQYYLYVVNADFGPLFIKFCSYFPYTGRVCLNGHEYAKRQAAKAGIGFTA